MDEQENPVSDVVDTFAQMANEGDVRVDALVEEIGEVALAPCLLLPALLVVSPLSGIPLFSTFCAVLIVLIASQGAIGRSKLKLPKFIRKWHLSSERAQRAVSFLGRMARLIDKRSRPRLMFLTTSASTRVIYTICTLAALCVPLLEFIPFSSSVVAAGVSLLAVAILTRDGLFAIAGFSALCIGLLAPFFVVTAVLA